MDELVANLKLAMGDRIRGNSWMSPKTKEAALEKLSKMDVMVGYPEKWRDYAPLEISAADLYGNVERSGEFDADYRHGLPRQAGRPQAVGDEPADGERLQRRA